MSQIVVVHAQDVDATKVANNLISELSSFGYEAVSYQQAILASSKESTFEKQEDLICEAQAVIVLASPQLFRDQSLQVVVEMSKISGKFIPVVSGFVGAHLPFWFSIRYINLNTDGVERCSKLYELVRSLVRLGVQAA